MLHLSLEQNIAVVFDDGTVIFYIHFRFESDFNIIIF